MTSRVSMLVLALATSAAAQPAPTQHPHSVFDAKVVSMGTASRFLCGGAMATQDVKLSVSKVDSGRLKVGATPTVRVLTCFGGHLLRPVDKDGGVFELDPDKIRPGSVIHIDAEELARDGWFATVDQMAVTKL